MSSPVITKLTQKPAWLADKDIAYLFKVLEQSSIEGRFVGGCVRDFLVGREVHDFDIAVDQAPEKVMAGLKKANIKVIPTGLSHGTVTAVINHTPYELTTLRKDVETDGRHAVVAFTDDWREDAARRDFTMNALYMDRNGQLYDYFDGWADIQNGLVRFVGDPFLRMTEDALRLLRFFRFSARYQQQDFDVDVLSVCQKFTDKMPNLAAERIWQEWKKLLVIEELSPTLQAMQQIGLFNTLYRDLPVEVTAEDIKRLESLMTDSPLLRLAALHINLSLEEAAILAKNLRFSNAEKQYFLGLYHSKDVFRDSRSEDFYKSYDHLGPDLVKDISILGELSGWAGDWENITTFADQIGQPKFPILGRDLLALGVEAGPELGQILKQIKDDWIKSGFQMDREACLSKAKMLK